MLRRFNRHIRISGIEIGAFIKKAFAAAIMQAFIILFFSSFAFCATIKFKNGNIVEGRIIEKTGEYVKIDFHGMPMTYFMDEIESISEAQVGASAPQTTQPAEESKQGNSDIIELQLNPMIELNFMTKKEIYGIRSGYVLQYPGLAKNNYSPSETVFGQIVDKRPWWGILGLSYYGAGKSSILGPAEESRFIANPFLLVGLDCGIAINVNDRNLEPIAIYPEALSLEWSKDGSFARVKYDIASLWRKQKQYHYPPDYIHRLSLVTYNAQDLGFNYLYVVPEKSNNFYPFQASNSVAQLRHLIHCGGSCGYTGGCNNMSPTTPDLDFKLSDLPAVLYIKLWRNQPKSRDQEADMVFMIQMQ